MPKVRLELNRLIIHRPKQRWRIYFVIIAEHPDDPEKMLITTVPEIPIRVLPEQKNDIDFGGDGDSEGLLLLRRKMPVGKELNVHCYIRHSRKDLGSVGEILTDLQKGIGSDALGLASDVLGTANPWLVITKSALPLIGKVLQEIPDRDLGFVSMFERFGPEFDEQGEVDIERRGGAVTVVYSWSVDR